MAGETELAKILASLQPDLLPKEYVFISLAEARYGDLPDLKPFAAIREAEGLTLVIAQESAERNGIHFDSTFRCITLRVHSSLEAVGLTAAVSTALAQRGISANMIAGYYHDHVFIQAARAEEALEVLISLAHSTWNFG